MPAHLQKVQAHAERELIAVGAGQPAEVLASYRRFRKVEEHRLRLKHQAGGSGREICLRRANLIDVILGHVFPAAMTTAGADPEQDLALYAIGGYGRGELNPSSDIDIMFLHQAHSSGVPQKITVAIEKVLYLLWDIGFKVGHSTRSSAEAIALANSDMLTKTALLESRFVAGDRKLGRLFRDQFRDHCIRGFEREYIEQRLEDQAGRHGKFGNSVYMQEPHVKNGCGGLRDYQNLLWMTYFRDGELSTTPLVGRSWLSEPDRRQLDRAYDFLLRVRTDLHYVTGRATDVLHLSQQEQLARRLQPARRGRLLQSESFMRDYYGHTRNIFRVTERITAQFSRGAASGRLRALLDFLPRVRATETRLGAFISSAGELALARPEALQENPELLMEGFEVIQEHNLSLNPELEAAYARALPRVTRSYQYAPAPRDLFKKMLSRKGEVARVLRHMHRVDFLGRYLPEFGQLTCLVQHEFFHRYTADEHTLVCLDKLDALTVTEEPKLLPYRKLFETLENPLVLYLALLLHDTGRAVRAHPHAEASAVFAQRVANRLQLPPADRRSLVLLVDHHITLSKMAQHRNLDDPQTAIEFAGIVRDQRNLDALMLLTLADGQGTSAEGWSDWKETLVWELYHATTQYFTDQAAFFEARRIEREELQREVSALLAPDFADEIEAHFEHMPDNYLRAFPPPAIAQHLRLCRTYLANVYTKGHSPLVPALHWEAFPREGSSVVAFCSIDRPQLLAKIAGSFSIIPLNILSADIYTRGDSLVLNVFRVCTSRGEAVSDASDIAKVEMTLGTALEDNRFEFGPVLKRARRRRATVLAGDIDFPTRISADNRAHPGYTLLHVETPDRLGLLFDLLACLDREGVYIAFSRISTEKGAAIDTFYILDSRTRAKITEQGRIASLQNSLQAAIEPAAAR